MRRKALSIFIIVLLGAVTVLGFMIFKKLSAAQPAAEERSKPAVAVEVSPVRRGSIREIRRLTGTLAAARRADISPKISGRIEGITVDLGDKVTRGEVIARLDSDELAQAVAEARSDLEVAKANLLKAQSEEQQAQRELERVERLREREVASESDLEAARLALNVQKANVTVAESQVTQSEAALRSAEIRLDYAEIRAEWTEGGDERFVAARFAEEGELVAANETIVSLVDLSVLNAVLFVTERDYPRLDIGQEVAVTADAFPGREFVGRVSRMAPRFEENSRQARVEVKVPNESGILKPGMFVRASVLLQDKRDVTLVPTRAVVSRERVTGVFVVERATNSARFVPVTPGIQEGGATEIVEPHLEGEIVTLGQNLIDQDTPLNFVAESGADDAGADEGTAAAGGDGT